MCVGIQIEWGTISGKFSLYIGRVFGCLIVHFGNIYTTDRVNNEIHWNKI